MNGGVADERSLDYATIQIIPSENRYKASLWCSNEVVALDDGLLDSLLPHLPEVKELTAKGSTASIKLQLPGSPGTSWFTQSTFSSFFRLIGSPDLMNIMKTMNEMAQLEEAKKFHLALYCQDKLSSIQDKDGCLDGTSPKDRTGAGFATSAASKNELLRAMDLRLKALNKDLTAAFDKACGPTCTPQDIIHLAKFLEHFGTTNLKNCASKYLELKSGAIDPINDDEHVVTSNLNNDNASNTYGSSKAENLHSSTPVKYGVSPAKVAQVEREGSTESEKSSDSESEIETPAERSRTMTRSAISRRSASPMRRIQIGRTGFRRVPALSIKSLNHLQTREHTLPAGDATVTSDDEEGFEPSGKKAENNLRRISVQDAISLFESKQKNGTVDIQKGRSLVNPTVSANKLVLRRWSTGMGEASTEGQTGVVCEKSHPISHVLEEDVPKITEGEAESDDIPSIDKTCITAEVDVKLENPEIEVSDSLEIQVDSPINHPPEVVQKIMANSEWYHRKEAELDQMLKKVTDLKRVTPKNPRANRKKDANSEQRGRLTDKGKRDEKPKVGEAKVSTANKGTQLRGMRQSSDDRRSKVASTEVSINKTRTSYKSEISHANLCKPDRLKKEISKPPVTGKISSKTLPLSSTRKSWPSAPSERIIGMLPTSTNASRQKTQSLSASNRSNTKSEKPLMQKKNVKETKSTGKDSVHVNEKKPAIQTKNGKITKSKVMTPTRDSPVPVKSVARDKATKKSSIVPLESKSFHKSSRNSLDSSSPVVSTTSRTKCSKPADAIKSSKNLTLAHEIEVTASEVVNEADQGDVLLSTICDSEPLVNDQKASEQKTSDEVSDEHDELQIVNRSLLEVVVQEELLSPSKSREEIEEFQEIPSNNEDASELATQESTAPIRSPRVRLSLSQMLQEENSEPDNNDWGIAENPPMMNYQRDAPKGFKRLLKFARKSRGEASLAGWSSPSVVSEGEDDFEETKSANSKKAENLLMKATQNSGLARASQDKNFDIEKLYSGTFGAQNFNSKFQENHDSSVSTTKVGRSFFSLSAFRGSKQSEPKLR